MDEDKKAGGALRTRAKAGPAWYPQRPAISEPGFVGGNVSPDPRPAWLQSMLKNKPAGPLKPLTWYPQKPAFMQPGWANSLDRHEPAWKDSIKYAGPPAPTPPMWAVNRPGPQPNTPLQQAGAYAPPKPPQQKNPAQVSYGTLWQYLNNTPKPPTVQPPGYIPMWVVNKPGALPQPPAPVPMWQANLYEPNTPQPELMAETLPEQPYYSPFSSYYGGWWDGGGGGGGGGYTREPSWMMRLNNWNIG